MSCSHPLVHLAGVIVFLGIANATQGEEPAVTVKDLRVQKAGETTYFHVTLDNPVRLRLPRIENLTSRWELPHMAVRLTLSRLPRLVPVDGLNRAAYFQLPLPLVPERITTLEFVGTAPAADTAEFVLLYPSTRYAGETKSLAPSLESNTWREIRVSLDFRKAKKVKPFKAERSRELEPDADDLEGRWAEARARELAVQEQLAPEFGYYGLAREAVGRKYKVPARPFPKPLAEQDRSTPSDALRLYETSTGSAALAETLARHRMLNAGSGKKEERVFDLYEVRELSLAEHPWEKMMAGKKPAVEPLASLIPHDNYYVVFRDIRKLLDLRDLAEHWGSIGIAAYELQSRDLDLSKRYERQLCLKSSGLARTLGPAVIRGIAMTGNDLYLREGSDVTIIFHVRNAALFLAAVQPQVEATRKEYGDRLKQETVKHHGVDIESFRTALREVSLHRATVGDFVIYSNSPIGVRRVLDAHAGRAKRLADSLDFRYMRTVFVANDVKEDGFVFLSDAFIRQMVGPKSKIKEKRRVEALTSLYMVTHAALFCATETGHLPRNHHELFRECRLRPREIDTPDGEARWDFAREAAVSDVYNTIHFATPLIEVPIDKVDIEERREYERFRLNYSRGWRQYLDPAGLRLSLRETEVVVELYLLPLVETQAYEELKRFAGGGTTDVRPGLISARALIQFQSNVAENDSLLKMIKSATVSLDDATGYERFFQAEVRRDLGDITSTSYQRRAELTLLHAPLSVILETRNGMNEELRGVAGFIPFVAQFIDPECKRDDPDHQHRNIKMTRISLRHGQLWQAQPDDPDMPLEKEPRITFNWAFVDSWLLFSLRQESLKDTIDRTVAAPEKHPAQKERIPVNCSLYIAPKALVKSAPAVRGFLEWQTLKRSLPNTLLWSTLYDSGVLPRDATSAAAKAIARKFFGFVPVSPDGAAYRYDARTAEVVNTRHGSMRSPKLYATIADDSPLAKLLEEVQTIRADLRFREDGIHTVVTIQRKARK